MSRFARHGKRLAPILLLQDRAVPRHQGTAGIDDVSSTAAASARACFQVAPEDLEEQLRKLVRREITVKPPNNIPRWITVETEQGSLRAIAFVMNRQSRFYIGKLSPEEVAEMLAKACGHWGSCAEYLHNTAAHLAEHGISDRNLWHLQACRRADREGSPWLRLEVSIVSEPSLVPANSLGSNSLIRL